MSNDYIGKLVKGFESGTKGSLSLSSCGNDWGVSCGSYQLTLRFGNAISFLKKYFPTESKNLYFNKSKHDIASKTYPGSDYCSSPDEVKTVWKKCYNTVGADKFFEYEHEYIRINYYEPILKKLVNVFNPNNHSRMAQECIWSWSVHKGPSGAYNNFMEACEKINPQTTLAENLIDILYNKRYSVNRFNRYKKGLLPSVSERELLRSYCNIKPLQYTGTSPSNGTATGIKNETPKVEVSTKTVLYKVQVGAFKVKQNAVNRLTDVKKAGFKDAFISYSSSDKLYRVQVGAFTNIKNATNYVTLIKKKGFEAVLSTYVKS